jgi:hypothetical protein
MIKYIASEKYSLHWIIFHAVLGMVSSFTPWILIFWFYAVLFLSLSDIFNTVKRKFVLNWLMVYLVSFEMLSRMAGTSPFIPYELGKYLLFALLVYGIIVGNRKGTGGFLMLLLLIPGMLMGYFESGLKTLVFNALGPVNIALGIVYFRQQRISFTQFISYIRLLLFPILSVLFFTLIKSPQLDEIEFSLGANFETTGGFGSNQISTVFGAAVFLLFLFVWNRWKFSPHRWLDIVLLILFAFRGLISFSRGGMIGGALAILVVLLIQSREISTFSMKTRPSKKKILIYAPMIITALFITFTVADNVTGGMLSLRYQGETAGTLAGTKEKSLTTFTSNRNDIFTEDIEVFTENPLLGVGVGQSIEFRKITSGQLPHIELSRLLSEHGLLGLVYFLILLYQGFLIFRNRHKMYYSNILLAFFVLALYTTFHAATRTYFTPLFLGLSMLTIINNRKKEITTSKEIALKNNTELNDSPLGDALSSAKRVSDSL